MTPSCSGAGSFPVSCNVTTCNNDNFYISIEVPNISIETQNPALTRLHNLLKNMDGLFSLEIYYEQEEDIFSKTLKVDTYRICLDHSKIYCFHSKHTNYSE
ncbi:hypothetical protein CDIK_1353 [Cucumispora dikerogammari]|nr:hypothetical protein CDIK_1353 [Cucumispora dikerogammari]